MGFFKRLFRIGQANVNAALDSMEEPVKMIEQILRELEDDLAKVTAAVTTQMAVEKRFERELKEASETVEKRDQQARKAMEKGEEDLAREALLDKKRYTEKRDALQSNYDIAKANSDKLRKQLQNMKDKVDEMKAQKGTLVAQAQAARATKKINETMSTVGGNNAGANFARMEEKIQQMHDEANAAQELADDGKSLDDKFSDMLKESQHTDVDDELAALRAEMKKE
jgi:phage shock protein A